MEEEKNADRILVSKLLVKCPLGTAERRSKDTHVHKIANNSGIPLLPGRLATISSQPRTLTGTVTL
jgi:hypothetical protein